MEDLPGGGRGFPGKILFAETEVFPRHLGLFSHEHPPFHEVPQLADVPFPSMPLHRFLRFPGESNHGLSRGGPPDLRLARLEANLAWFNQWLKP